MPLDSLNIGDTSTATGMMGTAMEQTRHAGTKRLGGFLGLASTAMGALSAFQSGALDPRNANPVYALVQGIGDTAQSVQEGFSTAGDALRQGNFSKAAYHATASTLTLASAPENIAINTAGRLTGGLAHKAASFVSENQGLQQGLSSMLRHASSEMDGFSPGVGMGNGTDKGFSK